MISSDDDDDGNPSYASPLFSFKEEQITLPRTRQCVEPFSCIVLIRPQQSYEVMIIFLNLMDEMETQKNDITCSRAFFTKGEHSLCLRESCVGMTELKEFRTHTEVGKGTEGQIK